MPSYTVGLPGGGDTTVNASSPAAAIENAGGSGVIIAGPGAPNPLAGSNVGAGVGQNPGISNNNGTPTTVTPQQQIQGSGIDALLQAAQRGDKETFEKTLNEQIREFDQKYGLDLKQFDEYVRQYNQNFGISEAGLTGSYKGAPTMQAQAQNAQLYGYVPTLNAQGVPVGPNGQPLTTLASQQQSYAQQLGLITTAASLQANPFRQQQVIGQMGNLLGGQGVAGFSAPNTVQGVGVAGGNTRGGMGYLDQMIQDIRDPTANTASMNQVMAGIPTPNKLNSTEFLRAAPSTQSMVLQGMQEKFGIDPNDALQQIKNTLPQFTAPTTVGSVKR